MRDGSGHHFAIHFGPSGRTLILGLAHECPGSKLSLADLEVSLPADFAHFFEEPAFAAAKLSFCIWNAGGGPWCAVPIAPPERNDSLLYRSDPDGSESLLFILAGDPSDYQRFAANYYEVELDRDLIELVYDHATLHPEMLASIRPDADWTETAQVLATIGYPTRRGTR